MTRLLTLSALALSLLASPTEARTRRPSIKRVCAGEVLPFPVPDLTEATDSAYASWMEGAWKEFCEDARPGSYEARACACAPAFDF